MESRIKICLVEPEIPPNTGNIARLCAATYSELHIVGVTGFRLDDKAVKRAGLDYWNEVKIQRHIDLQIFIRFSARIALFVFFDKSRPKIYGLAIPAGRLSDLRARNPWATRRPFGGKPRTMSDDPDAESKRPQSESGNLGRHRSL